ncbi:HAD-IA family hydrolase [Paenibacillus sp. QZ-Y1]|uniref:HAD-IA family hydrolase n=1 Tax=Paenibacillus sp. QZ-Y1 TaxID=3414511 RepID=UPI003F7A8EFD
MTCCYKYEINNGLRQDCPVRGLFLVVYMSNQVGYCKPNIEIYELVQSHIHRTAHIIYVDDQAKNLKPATELGWETLLADQQHHWIAVIDEWLVDQH